MSNDHRQARSAAMDPRGPNVVGFVCSRRFIALRAIAHATDRLDHAAPRFYGHPRLCLVNATAPVASVIQGATKTTRGAGHPLSSWVALRLSFN